MHAGRGLADGTLFIPVSGIGQSSVNVDHNDIKIWQTAQEAMRVVMLDSDTGEMWSLMQDDIGGRLVLRSGGIRLW